MMDLHRLRLLREVHVRGTMHAAAEALGYSTSSVSQQLSVLEREAGTPLLERVGRRVVLTDAGHVLVRHADSLLEGAEAAAADVAAIAAGEVAGVVRVAAFQSAFLHIVLPALGDLARTHPQVTVEVTEAEVEDASPALRLQQLDVLVGDEYGGHPRVRHPDLERTTLLRERMNMVLSRDHPAAAGRSPRLADLARLPWAACQPGTAQHRMHTRVCREAGGFEPDVRYTSDDFTILLALVAEAGAGTLLPDLAVRSLPDGVVARPLDVDVVGREVFLMTRRGRTPAVRAVARALVAAGRAAGEG